MTSSPSRRSATSTAINSAIRGWPPVSGELHLPLNTPTTIHVTSRDVIHGFWIPEMRIKADMVPGLINTLRVTPTVPGRYPIICTEFCGVGHGAMKTTLVVESQQNFSRWFAQQGGSQSSGGGGGGIPLASGSVDAGKVLFGQKCSACHSTGPFTQKIVGPGLGQDLQRPRASQTRQQHRSHTQDVATIIKNGYQGDIGTMPSAR